ncbi:MAG: DNA-directed RNA polymerase subunit K [Candidatus Hodarchaeaceae archaeon]|nr:DNA-directed RNA polymerase subunit K [Candidatus Hodarchaeaceae archaeon]
MSSRLASWRKRRREPGLRKRWAVCRLCDGGSPIFPKKYTRFEKARIIGARVLQVSMGAPVLINLPEGVVNPIDIALLEFEKGAIPITVVRRLPGEKRGGKNVEAS